MHVQDVRNTLYFLASCYDSGVGVPQDADMAKHYYGLAAQLGASNEDDILALLNE